MKSETATEASKSSDDTDMHMKCLIMQMDAAKALRDSMACLINTLEDKVSSKGSLTYRNCDGRVLTLTMNPSREIGSPRVLTKLKWE